MNSSDGGDNSVTTRANEDRIATEQTDGIGMDSINAADCSDLSEIVPALPPLPPLPNDTMEGPASSSSSSTSSIATTPKRDQSAKQKHEGWIVESLFELKNTTPAPTGKKRKGEGTTGSNSAKKKAAKAKTIVTGKKMDAAENPTVYKNGNAASSKTTINKSDETWNKRLIELMQFKEQHGHCNVPQKYEGNPTLGAWVARNRLFMRAWEEDPKSISISQAQRAKVLKEVGLVSGIGKGGFNKSTGVFLSSKNASDWENQFKSLKEYKETYGNCDVPVKSETHRSLGRWISAQRRKYQQHLCNLTPGAKPDNDLVLRFQRLEDIGFKFSIGSGNAQRKHFYPESFLPTTQESPDADYVADTPPIQNNIEVLNDESNDVNP